MWAIGRGRFFRGGCAALLLLLTTSWKAEAVTPIPECEPNQATTDQCVIPISLETGSVIQTFPFDVPVFLQGEAPPELASLIVHVFQAPEPVRVERSGCDDSDDSKCFYTCYGQAPSRSSGTKKQWSREALAGKATALEADCSLTPRAAIWSRPSTRDQGAAAASAAVDAENAGSKFLLRLPPLQANRHFVLLIETRNHPTPEQAERVQRAVNESVGEVLRRLSGQSSQSNLSSWLTELAKEGCKALDRVAQEEGILLVAEEGSLFECKDIGDLRVANAVQELRPQVTTQDLNLLTEFYSAEAEIGSNLEACAEEWPELEDLLVGLKSGLPETAEEDAGSQDGQKLLQQDENTLKRWARGNPSGDVRLEGNPCEAHPPSEVVQGYQELKTRLEAAQAAAREELPEDQQQRLDTHFQKAIGLAESLRGYAGAIAASRSADILVYEATALVLDDILLAGDTIGTFMTRQKSYLAADFGFAFVPEVDQALPYLGANIYLSPVNKNAPLGWGDWNWRKRFAFTIGITLQEIDHEQGDDLFSDMSLLTGGGFRITESVRLSGGVLWLREESENPLDDRRELAWSPYASLSLDYDVNSLIKWFGKIFN